MIAKVRVTLFQSLLDPGQQPITVETSGFTANETITFVALSGLSQVLPSFDIANDDIGLETDEYYAIQLVSSDPSVDLGSDSTIRIIDDDGKNCV